MKKRLTVLAVLVATALVVSGFAVPSMAAESAEPVTETAQSEAVTIVREDESLRGEYEKHFLMSDGTYQAVVYSEPVHTMVDGTWVETDNVMTADADTGTDSDRMNILDNYVMEGYGVQNNNLDRLYIGTKSGCLCRGFIQFKTMPTIPEGSTITSATMTLDILDGTAIARNASAYMVEEAWVSGELQWSNQPDATVLLAADISHNEQTKFVFSCVDAVRHWYDGDSTGMNENYGIMVRYYDETLINYNSFYSADCAYESKRPVIAITYEPPAETIPDGVYYIKAGIGLYLGTSGGTADNTPVNLLSHATSGIAQVYQLWKITYLGNGYYSIRPLHKLDMGLHVTSNSVDITTTDGAEDTLTDVTSQNRWGIEVTLDGKYHLNNVGTSSMSMTYPNTVITSGMSVITGINDGASDSFKWELIRLDDSLKGVVLYHTPTQTAVTNFVRYITKGESCTLENYGLSPMIYSGDGLSSVSMQWSCSGSGLSVLSSTGTVTGSSDDTTYSAVVTGTCELGTVQFTVKCLKFQEGTYFIQNEETKQYADIASDSFGSGTAVNQQNIDGANTQRWILEHLGDGTYTIRTGASTTPYYLGVQADSTSDGAVVVLRSGTITDGMRWKLQSVIQDKYCRLTPASGEYGDMALTGGESCLQQMVYGNNDYRDKWHLHKEKDYTLMYIGFMEGEETIKSVRDAVDAAMKEDAQMDGEPFASMTEADLKLHLSTSKVVSCVTHGLQGSIEASDGWLTVSDVNALSDDAFDDLKLVYLGACHTGAGGSGADNLVNALFEKGADVVVGFTIEVDVDETYVWTQAFMESIALGNMINKALIDADEALSDDHTLGGKDSYTVFEDYRYIKGSVYAIPCP